MIDPLIVFQPFLEQLHQFERAVQSESNPDVVHIRHLLQVELTLADSDESGTVMLRPSTGSEIFSGDRRGWNRLASVVLAYRLADVIGLLNNVQIPQPRKVLQTKRLGNAKFPEVIV